MRGQQRNCTYQLAYTVSSAAALLLALTAANWGMFMQSVWPGAAALALLGAAAASVRYKREPAPLLFAWTGKLALPMVRDSEYAACTGRWMLLFCAPLFFACLAAVTRSPATVLTGYLVGLGVATMADGGSPDAMLGRMVACGGLLFLASLPGGVVRLVLCFGALMGMLLMVNAYLLMVYYPEHGRRQATGLILVSLQQILPTFAVAGALASVGTMLLTGSVARAAALLARAAGHADDDLAGVTIGTDGMRSLYAVILGLLVAYLLVKMVVPKVKPDAAEEMRVLAEVPAVSSGWTKRRFWGAGRSWHGPRKRIIASYTKLRAALGRRGFERGGALTPAEYAAHVGSAADRLQDDLTELTGIFVKARYAEEEPNPAMANRAAALAHRITRQASGEARPPESRPGTSRAAD